MGGVGSRRSDLVGRLATAGVDLQIPTMGLAIDYGHQGISAVESPLSDRSATAGWPSLQEGYVVIPP